MTQLDPGMWVELHDTGLTPRPDLPRAWNPNGTPPGGNQ